jgi:hypothetical protein
MTNFELMKTPREQLSALDRQKQYVLLKELTPVPCPVCKEPLNALSAAGIDVDQFDFGRTKYEYRCRHCQAELELVIPVITVGGPGWQWQIKHEWLTAMLAKAWAYDRDNAPKE